jgi:predicted RecB family nuclease
VRAALEQIENLSQQEPPIPADIPNLGEEDDLHILGLTPRALGVLQRGGVMTITQLRQYDRNRKLWGLYGMGPMLMDEIIEKCAARGISIRKF